MVSVGCKSVKRGWVYNNLPVDLLDVHGLGQASWERVGYWSYWVWMSAASDAESVCDEQEASASGGSKDQGLVEINTL